jgi:L-ascorbate metabolism protein UlaG (beta-lactamase superfamily)
MKRILVSLIFVLAVTLSGCAGKTDTSAAADEKPKKDLVLPIVGNRTGKVMIQTVSSSQAYRFNSYIITSKAGKSVVLDPTAMPKKSLVDLKPVAIVSTHGHSDHVDSNFSSSYKAKNILFEKKDLRTGGFHIYTVLSAHTGNTLGTTNVIAVIEVDGLRIAHMGDIGQDRLTDGQLEELGRIDIAFMQFENGYSDMSLANGKGFALIEQLNPQVIIPTHYTSSALPVIEEKYGRITDFSNVLEVSREDVPAEPLTVWRISNTHKYW